MRKKLAERPWIKLWRVERGAFAQLPFVTRAVGTQILKYLDDHGRLALGGRTAAEAVAFRAGATRGDRRVIANAIPELVNVGFLRVTDTHLEAPAYVRRQYGDEGSTVARNGSESDLTEQRSGSDADPTASRSGSEPDLTAPRSGSESEAKPAESLGSRSENPTSTIALEKRREEGEKSRGDEIRHGDDLRGVEGAWAQALGEVSAKWVQHADDARHFKTIRETSLAERGADERIADAALRLARQHVGERLKRNPKTQLRPQYFAEWCQGRAGTPSPQAVPKESREEHVAQLKARLAAQKGAA